MSKNHVGDEKKLGLKPTLRLRGILQVDSKVVQSFFQFVYSTEDRQVFRCYDPETARKIHRPRSEKNILDPKF
jgi:hypothetical protein